ncbi:hypothetical protein D9599_20740 [Roseomonas sp. KE2513]|uniref:c-type cytochrome n=1 Tax=Roseomonas sp. KE2513 TaxID=2479202 RepID=UPI0018E04FC8|nr:c-type cytochrome [Roseomonas sp. KE2513]MBI0537992.1 hypothetical protein [Roseomonas sp. KE2513]
MRRAAISGGKGLALAAIGLFAAVEARAADAPAGAACLSDASRAAAARERAPEDQRGHLDELIASAERAARDKDGEGCRRAADDALRTAGLPPLAPILLSTSMAGERRGAEAAVPPPPAPGSPAGSAPGNTTPAGEAAAPQQGQQQAAAPPQQGAQQQAAAPAPAPAPATQQPAPAAAPPPAQVSAAAPAGDAAPWLITGRELLGKRVVAMSNYGTELGTVEDLVISGATEGRVTYLIIRPAGARGGAVASLFGTAADVIVPLQAMRFSGQTDAVRLDATIEKLRDAPRFRAEDIRRLQDDPTLGRALAVYYGVEQAPAEQAPAPAPTQQAAATPPSAAAPTAAPAPAGTANQTAAAPAPAGGASQPSPPAQQADAGHGKTVAGRVCTACHSLERGGPVRVGPPLWGVEGRQVASVSGFSYSGGLRNRGGTWDDASLDAFLKNPRGYAPGTRMAYPGIQNNRDRADVVAFLNTLR